MYLQLKSTQISNSYLVYCVCIEINFEQKWHFLIKFKQLKFIHDNQGSSVIISEQVL